MGQNLARSSRHRAQDAITGGSVVLADRGIHDVWIRRCGFPQSHVRIYVYIHGDVAIHDGVGVSICR